MDAKFLDEVLKLIKAQRVSFEDEIIWNYSKDRDEQIKFEDALKYLQNHGSVKRLEWGSKQYKLEITPEGKKFMNEGGFQAELEYKNNTLKYARESKSYARKAYIVAIISIIVSVLLFIVSKL
ncbi:MAG TPA: hypothetical protein VK483_02540 [Chitinophagaceae bacterium]|nr:hypothetical protein [Chitinophagaceae bacterium]